ncbi:Uncharacterized protein TPAR_02990, partial [Tolypocladium paradoxum]
APVPAEEPAELPVEGLAEEPTSPGLDTKAEEAAATIESPVPEPDLQRRAQLPTATPLKESSDHRGLLAAASISTAAVSGIVVSSLATKRHDEPSEVPTAIKSNRTSNQVNVASETVESQTAVLPGESSGAAVVPSMEPPHGRDQTFSTPGHADPTLHDSGPADSDLPVCRAASTEKATPLSTPPSAEQTEQEPSVVQTTLALPMGISEIDPRAATPGIVVPDTEMVNLHRARTLRRKQKLAVRNAEDTVAAAVVIYATVEALSPPESPSLGALHGDGKGVPSLGHDMILGANSAQSPDEFTRRRSLKGQEDDLRESVTDLFTDGRSRELGSSSGDKDREGHRRHRHSHHSSTHSSRTRVEEEGKESRRRSSRSSHSSHRHRADSAGSRANSKTPPRTPKRHDSGYSGDSSGSSGKRRRTPEEQAEHERRKAERQLKEKEPERRESSTRDRKSKEPEAQAERSHRSSRRQSHSSHSRSEQPKPSASMDREPIILVQPEKRFFDVKNSEGIVGPSPPTPPVVREAAIPPPVSAKEASRPDDPKRSSTTRSKHSSSRQSTDQSRPKSSKSPDDTVPNEPKSSDKARSPPEDAARRARHSERRKAKEEEKKPGGLRGLVKRLFTSS